MDFFCNVASSELSVRATSMPRHALVNVNLEPYILLMHYKLLFG